LEEELFSFYSKPLHAEPKNTRKEPLEHEAHHRISFNQEVSNGVDKSTTSTILASGKERAILTTSNLCEIALISA
jgi:hypothetical protein